MTNNGKMTWSLLGPTSLRVLQDPSGGKIVIELKGVGQLAPEHLEFREIAAAVEAFRLTPQFERVTKLREALAVKAEQLGVAQEACDELRSANSTDAESIVYATDDVDSLRKQHAVLVDLFRKAYQDASRELDRMLTAARDQIFQAAREGKRLAVAQFCESAAAALTELFAFQHRMNQTASVANRMAPRVEELLGPALDLSPPTTEDSDGLPVLPVVGTFTRQFDFTQTEPVDRPEPIAIET